MSEQIGIAIFGLGRAGMIHLVNLVKNYRVILRYIVETDVTRAEEAEEKYFLKDTTIVHYDSAHAVYTDDR